MSYGEPAHGWWCNARTYPTRCKYCGKRVFFFTCDCGSKVFFDKLGWPWPIHDCTEYIQAQVEIAIQEKYARKVTKRQEWQAPIVSCEAIAGRMVDDVGVVREIVYPVDVYKKLRIPRDSHVGAQLLGPLAEGVYVQVTVHVENLDDDTFRSYTFMIRRQEWEKLGAIRGDLLSFQLMGQDVPTRESVWLCTRLTSVW